MSDQSRRDWLITISSAAMATGLAERLKGENGHAGALPPGVYDPSTNHLSHALMDAERYHPIPPNCPTEYVSPRWGPFEPQFFSPSEFLVVRCLVQVILGENSDQSQSVEETAEWIDLRVFESDAARRVASKLDSLRRSLAVAYYGAAKMDKLAAEDLTKTCHEGLAWMSQQSADFVSLSPAEQAALVTAMSETKGGTPPGRFFTLLKTETIKGFYTSRTGLKELDFKGNAFYARSPGCPG